MTATSPAAALASLLGASADRALFLDFDGTLVDIAPTPDEVRVEPGVREHLARLRGPLGGALMLVSGRGIPVLDGFLSPLRLDAAGLHGIELRLGEVLRPCRPEEHPELRQALAEIRSRLAGEPGLLVEDKGCSFAVHWRLADRARAELGEALVEGAAERLGPGYRLQRGKMVGEILPARASKGAVIEDVLQRPPYRGRLPVFIGDDVTDEHGFAAVNARGGLSVKVGDGPTQAKRRLPGPAALRELLALWAEAPLP